MESSAKSNDCSLADYDVVFEQLEMELIDEFAVLEVDNVIDFLVR